MRTCLAVLALIGFAAGMDCRAETVFVNLRPEAEVGHSEVKLSDIAEVVSRDATAADQLGRSFVDKCPSLALPCRLERSRLAPAIETRAAQMGARLVWGANESVALKGRMAPLPLSSAIDHGAIRILQRMDQGYPLAVNVKDAPDSIDAPPGAAEFRPDFNEMRRIGAVIELPINVLVDGVSVARPIIRYGLRHGFASGKPELPRPVAASSRQDKPALLQRPWQGTAGAFQDDRHASEGPAGNVLVAKNRKVRLLIDSGPVRVEAEGIALADAGPGGTVDIRRANGLADIRGRVIDHGTVLVEEN